MNDRVRSPWDGATGGLRDAIWRLHKAARRRPTQADAPAVSVLPMTPAAREALRLNREQAKRVVSRERRRELTHGTDA